MTYLGATRAHNEAASSSPQCLPWWGLEMRHIGCPVELRCQNMNRMIEETSKHTAEPHATPDSTPSTFYIGTVIMFYRLKELPGDPTLDGLFDNWYVPFFSPPPPPFSYSPFLYCTLHCACNVVLNLCVLQVETCGNI